jgi:GR25 family glycosyltransferase involved in LPS biosynthesis
MKQFDKIYCINLDSRTDRWEECLEEFKKLGISDTVERFSARRVDGVDAIAGCTKSHVEIIKLAKSRGEKNIIIFEDDFQSVRDSFWDDLEITLDQLKNNNLSYDLLYFGGRITGERGAEIVDKNLLRVFGVKTVHAYAVNERVYDFIIDSFDKINWNEPNNWLLSNKDRLSVDVWYMNKIQSKGNSYGIYPAIFQQRTSHSDLLDRVGGEELWNVEESWNNVKDKLDMESMDIIYRDIKNFDNSKLVEKITRPEHKVFINNPAGVDHYRLLAYLSTKVNDGLIIEMGTANGTSSTALSTNPTNKIITYDVRDRYTAQQPSNVEIRVGNIFKLKQEDILLKSDFIFLDTEHLGDFEWQVFCYLRDNGYKSFIIFDDIHWNKQMVDFWNKIPDELKHDITDIGHGANPYGQKSPIPGTGLVDFGGKINLVK